MFKTILKVIIIAIIVYVVIKFIDTREVCDIVENVAVNIVEQDWMKIFKMTNHI